MSGKKPNTFAGTRDWFGDDERLRQWAVGKVREVYESFGFEPLVTPAIEFQEVLFGEESETSQRIFDVRIKTRGYDDVAKRTRHKPLGLRYDHTVPLARVAAQHSEKLVLPYKRYAIGPVWRPEKPQEGRYREFFQVDFDTVGSSSAVADAEVIAVLSSAAEAVGLKRFTAIFNHRALLDGMAIEVGAISAEQVTEILRSWDKIGKTDFKDVPARLASAGLSQEALANFQSATEELQTLSGTNEEKLSYLRRRFRSDKVAEGLDQVESILDLVGAYSGVAERLEFTPYLARGFAYYTGPVFEMVTGSSNKSFAGGGRFDHLIEDLGGPDLPATGASFGLERFVKLIPAATKKQALGLTSTQVFVTIFAQDQELMESSTKIAQELRSLGYSVELYSGSDTIGRQITAADRKQIPLVVIVGPEELSSGTVTLKDMVSSITIKDKTANQQTVPVDQLSEVVREFLA